MIARDYYVASTVHACPIADKIVGERERLKNEVDAQETCNFSFFFFFFFFFICMTIRVTHCSCIEIRTKVMRACAVQRFCDFLRFVFVREMNSFRRSIGRNGMNIQFIFILIILLVTIRRNSVTSLRRRVPHRDHGARVAAAGCVVRACNFIHVYVYVNRQCAMWNIRPVSSSSVAIGFDMRDHEFSVNQRGVALHCATVCRCITPYHHPAARA